MPNWKNTGDNEFKSMYTPRTVIIPKVEEEIEEPFMQDEKPSEMSMIIEENKEHKQKYLPGHRLLKKLIKSQEKEAINKRIENRLKKLLI